MSPAASVARLCAAASQRRTMNWLRSVTMSSMQGASAVRKLGRTRDSVAMRPCRGTLASACRPSDTEYSSRRDVSPSTRFSVLPEVKQPTAACVTEEGFCEVA